LVAALLSLAEKSVKPDARSFLQGLSFDELEFIAGYFGGCILESTARPGLRPPVPRRIAGQRLPAARSSELRVTDRDHKMIVLMEFLCRCGASTPTRAHIAARS
jgi:hypothetical protein